MGRRLLPLACVLILVSIPVTAQQWMAVRSTHFKVLTDAGEEPGREVALRFEQMRAIFSDMFHRAKLNAPVPLDIVAFRSQDGFIRYVPQTNGKPTSLTGFFQGAADRNFIGIDMSSSDPFGTVSHEYAHLLLRNNFPVMPLWFDEGFAEYFAAVQIGNKQMTFGAIPPQLAAVLGKSQWLPMTALFAVQHDAKDGSDRSPMFYAESWLAVHYLLSNDTRLQSAFKYLHLAQIEHVPVADTIQQAFGVDAATLEKNLRAHLAANPTLATEALPDVNPEPYEAKDVGDADAKAILADMHAHSDNYKQQALTEFQAVLKQDPQNEIANRGIGYLYLRSGQFDQAQQALTKALAANEADAQAHYWLAYLVGRKGLKTGLSPDQVIAMRSHLQRAVQLEPELAYAHDLLAYALSEDRKPDMAIAEEKRAIALDPSAEIYQANLAQIYLKAQRLDDAEAVLKRLQASSSDPKIHDNVTQNLAAVAKAREEAVEKKRVSAMGVSDPTAPQWRMTKDIKAEDAEPAKDDTPKFDTRKTLYMKAELESVDCSGKPAAVVTVRKGPKLMRLRTDDYTKLIVMGADEFSCNWHGKKVLVNYKPGGRSDGDLVTLEVEQ